MLSTKNRVLKLERVIAPPAAGKYIVIRGGATDDEVTDLLREKDIDGMNPAHTAIVLRNFCETRDGASIHSRRNLKFSM